MKGVYSMYSEALHEIREKDTDIQKNFADRYGIDMKEIFEDYYKADKETSVSNENETPEAPKEDTSDDDMLS